MVKPPKNLLNMCPYKRDLWVSYIVGIVYSISSLLLRYYLTPINYKLFFVFSTVALVYLWGIFDIIGFFTCDTWILRVDWCGSEYALKKQIFHNYKLLNTLPHFICYFFIVTYLLSMFRSSECRVFAIIGTIGLMTTFRSAIYFSRSRGLCKLFKIHRLLIYEKEDIDRLVLKEVLLTKKTNTKVNIMISIFSPFIFAMLLFFDNFGNVKFDTHEYITNCFIFLLMSLFAITNWLDSQCKIFLKYFLLDYLSYLSRNKENNSPDDEGNQIAICDYEEIHLSKMLSFCLCIFIYSFSVFCMINN